MPIYDYRCEHCGHAFSVVRSFTDVPIEACPNCGKPPRKLLVTPAIVFKGSGWYKTDSRAKPKGGSDGASSGTTSDTKSDTKSDTTSETKSDTKSAPKTEAKTDTKPTGGAPGKSEGAS